MIQTVFHLQRPTPVLCCTPSMVPRPVLWGTNALATGHMEPMPCAEEPVGSSTSIPTTASLAWPCLYLNMHSKVSQEHNSISIVGIKKSRLPVLQNNPLIAGMTKREKLFHGGVCPAHCKKVGGVAGAPSI